MKVGLKVEVLSNGQPVPNAWVNFYIDDEWVGNELTDQKGVAGKSAGTLDEFGYHTWQVRVNKQGYDRLWSSEWKFNYQPRPVLRLYSDYGQIFGEGNYTYGDNALFGVSSTVVDIGEGKRMIFVGWNGYPDNGYSGVEAEAEIGLVNDVIEIAEWKTQYYLDMSCELPKHVFPGSGWIDEDELIRIEVVPPEGTEFLSWVGIGNESYTGTDLYHTIKVNGPVKEEALFEREDYVLGIESEYGSTWGGGLYPAWDNASFGLFDGYVYTEKGIRFEFIEWDSDSSFGYEGNKSKYQIVVVEDIRETATWQKQYYVNISGGDGGNVSAISGWFDENSRIILEATALEGYQFSGWDGDGGSSYSGMDLIYAIVINSPVNETARWKKQFALNIKSELEFDGAGVYLDGDTVTLQAQSSDGLIIRKVFKKWSGDLDTSKNPFMFTIRRDMEVTALYEKNYYGFLAILVIIIFLIGIFFYRMLKE